MLSSKHFLRSDYIVNLEFAMTNYEFVISSVY